jgi:hypothetical protein
VATIGAARARVVTGAGALASAAVVGALPVLSGGDRRRFLVALAVVGLGATAVALAGRPRALWWAIAALGGEYALSLAGRGPVDLRAPVVGGALLILAELTLWSTSQAVAHDDREATWRRAADLGVYWMVSIIAGALALAVRGVGERGDIAVAVTGVLAATTVLGMVAALARRRLGHVD